MTRKPVLGSVRARVTMLLALSAIPLVLIAVLLSFDNYLATVGQARELAASGLQDAVARHEAALQSTAIALARLPTTDPSAPPCAALGTATSLEPGRYAGLVLMDRRGSAVCQAYDPAMFLGEPAWVPDAAFQQAVRAGVPALGAPRRLGGTEILPLFIPFGSPAAALGVIVAAIRLDWLEAQIDPEPTRGNLDLWLLAPGGQGPLLARTPADRLPAAGWMPRPAPGPIAAAAGISRGGEEFSYATAPVRDGYALLAGYRPATLRAEARTTLARNLLGVALSLLVGLLIMRWGIGRAVVHPLRRLTVAVEHWRGGGAFESGSPAGMPTEVVDLSHAFSHATGALAAHEAQLRDAVAQQELLMQEIHHRVKNNLQIVASLLNLQASRIRLPEAKAEFQAARDRVRALATLHRHLYAEGELRTINMRSFLTELSGQLFQAMGERENDRIRLTVEAPELQMSSDQAVPLSLIVTEAVSNAIKYAFPGGRRGHIAVHLSVEDELAKLLIEDDGVGIPAGHGESESGPRDGLGIQLIRGFARQLGATLIVREGNGTRYEIAIPLRHDRPDGQAATHEEPAAA